MRTHTGQTIFDKTLGRTIICQGGKEKRAGAAFRLYYWDIRSGYIRILNPVMQSDTEIIANQECNQLITKIDCIVARNGYYFPTDR